MRFAIPKRPIVLMSITLAFFMQASLLFWIPCMGVRTFLSPDETANAAVARQLASKGRMNMEDSLLESFPWLHPRSFVTQGASIVPVGFLGLPIVLGVIWKYFGEWGMRLFTPLLVLSVLYPLWRMTKTFGRVGQIATAATWLSFPTVILYANRGLFPNLVVTCLMVWAMWEILRIKNPAKGGLSHESRIRNGIGWMVAGLIVGMAVAMRPTEIAWIVAWVVGAAFVIPTDRVREGAEESLYIKAISRLRRTQLEMTRSVVPFLLGAIIFPLLACFIAWKTYGSPFAVGYLLRDPEIGQAVAAAPRAMSAFPFGFHPRTLWWNVNGYLVQILGPWLAVTLVAGIAWARRKEARIVICVGVWTFAALCAMYGQAVYQDHVGVNVVSVGNSFLRYLLPLTPFAAVSAGALVAWIVARVSPSRAYFCVVVGIFALVGIGTWTAVSRDDEGLATSSVEILRYESIRSAVLDVPNAIVLSDRSDKIFFPASRVASPTPSADRVRALVDADVGNVLYFGPAELGKLPTGWEDQGLEVMPVFQSGNQRVYHVVK